jgi:hypothetical protein
MLGVSSCWFGPVLLFVAARIGAFSVWKRRSRVSSLHISVSSLKRAPVRSWADVRVSSAPESLPQCDEKFA